MRQQEFGQLRLALIDRGRPQGLIAVLGPSREVDSLREQDAQSGLRLISRIAGDDAPDQLAVLYLLLYIDAVLDQIFQQLRRCGALQQVWVGGERAV